jgi:hypothetical protein
MVVVIDLDAIAFLEGKWLKSKCPGITLFNQNQTIRPITNLFKKINNYLVILLMIQVTPSFFKYYYVVKEIRFALP